MLEIQFQKVMANLIFQKLEASGLKKIQIYDLDKVILAETPGSNQICSEELFGKAVASGKILFDQKDKKDFITCFIPIVVKGNILGCTVITDKNEMVKTLATFIGTTAELVVENYLILNNKPTQATTLQEFLYIWISTSLSEQTSRFFEKANLYGIDLNVKRVVVVLKTAPKAKSDLAMIKNFLRRGEFFLKLKENEFAIIGYSKNGLVERIERIFEYTNDIKIFVGDENSNVNLSFLNAITAMKMADFFNIKDNIVYSENIIFEQAIIGIEESSCIKKIVKIFDIHDPDKELKETLILYFLKNGNSIEVCKEMNIHRNTVNYRLRKIENLTGKNPKIFKDLFVLYAASLLDLKRKH